MFTKKGWLHMALRLCGWYG